MSATTTTFPNVLSLVCAGRLEDVTMLIQIAAPKAACDGAVHVQPTYAFEELTREQQVRVLEEARAALHLMESLLTDSPSWLAERQNALAYLVSANGVHDLIAWRRSHYLAALLPSFEYWDSICFIERLVHEATDEILSEDEIKSLTKSITEVLSPLRERLLEQARNEARVYDPDFDELLGGTKHAL